MAANSLGITLGQGDMTVDHSKWMTAYATAYGTIDAAKQQGIEFLLSSIDDDATVADVRWAAYMFATIKHECADRWQPLEEFGKGAGRPYGTAVTVTGADGQPHSNRYYGRGYVQITWKENYARLGKAIGMSDQLLLFPEKALDPSVAYRIMSEGMRRGLFSGKKLGDFINDKRCDYRQARQIINGLDQAERIKSYSETLECVFRQSVN